MGEKEIRKRDEERRSLHKMGGFVGKWKRNGWLHDRIKKEDFEVHVVEMLEQVSVENFYDEFDFFYQYFFD